MPQESKVSLSRVTPAIFPGDTHPTTAAAAPDVPLHETASATPNSSVEAAFDEHARDMDIRDKATEQVCRLHLHRQSSVSDLGG